jgi:MSHA biogenesis protein MshL
MQISRTPLYFGCVISLLAGGCTTIKPSDLHLTRNDAGTVQGKDIPPPIKNSIPLPPPAPAAKVETYSVVVTNVPAQEILFALARDAKVNLDIYPGVQGNITLNAINQTLPQILDRVSKQIDIRYELNGPNLAVMPDTPYLKQYKIDYVNMARDAEGGISNSTQVGSSITGAAGGAQGASTGNNNSQLTIKDVSKNRFWETLVQNIKDILHETDKILPAGSSETVVQQSSNVSTTGTGVQTAGSKKRSKAPGIENSPNPANLQEGGTTVTRTSTFREAASVIANPETGIITVRATGKQHEKIQQFIDQVMANARRQVMIEVTIAEVSLNKNYQQGIDWSRVLLAASTKGFTVSQGLTGGPFTTPPSSSTFVLGYTNPTSKLGNLKATVSLLSSFGDVKVLSSPTLSVMNNQTAMLRVVDNLVYFTVESNSSQSQTSIVTTYTTTPHSVPVGLTMSITPQISDTDSVQIDVRPSITRILTPVQDPNPTLANPCGVGVTGCTLPAIVSTIPQVQTREMESVLKIEDNQIAVLGGLMEDELNNQTYSVPLLGDIPLLGELFKYRNDTTTKTELVIFLRPTVIHSASVNEDFSRFRSALPGSDFLKPGDTVSSTSKP